MPVCMLCVYLKGCMCVCGGGQTSSQVPNTVSPRADSVSLKYPLHLKSDGKAQRRPQMKSKLVAGDTYRRGGINPACDPLGKQRVGGLLPLNLGVGGQRRRKSIWTSTCSLISVETRGGCAKRSIPRP